MRSVSPPVQRHAAQCPTSCASTTISSAAIARAMKPIPICEGTMDHTSMKRTKMTVKRWTRIDTPPSRATPIDHPCGLSGFSKTRPSQSR